MERRRIRDQIGLLEEQLEMLDDVALSNELSPISGASEIAFGEDILVGAARDSLHRLQEMVEEHSLQKSVPAREFLKRVNSVLIREASAGGLGDVAISTYGTGRISLDMVELSMGAILACLRACLKNHIGQDPGDRVRKRLFRTPAFSLEVHGAEDEIRFQLSDDGPGYRAPAQKELEGEKLLQRIRVHISRYGGWLQCRSLPGYGGIIEFRIPLPSARYQCLLLKGGNTELLLPAHCLSEVREGGKIGKWSGLVASLDENSGLVACSGDTEKRAPACVKVAIADFEFWIRCEEIVARVKSRPVPADGFVEPGCWFSHFGSFQLNGKVQLLPVLEGEALMRFYLENRRENESN